MVYSPGAFLIVRLQPGRKISKLERTLLVDAQRTQTAGYTLPDTDLKITFSYSPEQRNGFNPELMLHDKIEQATVNDPTKDFLRAGISAAEFTFGNIRDRPPRNGVQLQVQCIEVNDRGASPHSLAVVHQTDQRRTITEYLGHYFLRQQRGRSNLFLAHYTDWAEPPELVPITLSEVRFVADLHSFGTGSKKEVDLQLRVASHTYAPSTVSVYDSGQNKGFLPGFHKGSTLNDLLDHAALQGGQRLPAFAALLASASHIEKHLTIEKGGALDPLSTDHHRARYHLSVRHQRGYEFEVTLRTASSIGNTFGKPYTFHVDTEKLA